MMQLILGSSSTARQALLSRFRIPFKVISPDIDETLKENETAKEAVVRLANAKAEKIRALGCESVMITCDQLLSVNHSILGKPQTKDKAIAQLQRCSNQIIQSYTAVTVINTRTQSSETKVVEYAVKFKPLSEETIINYLLLDEPYHCAGSIKAESLGPTLFEWMRGDDPTALIGLPLIVLSDLLESNGIQILKPRSKP